MTRVLERTADRPPAAVAGQRGDLLSRHPEVVGLLGQVEDVDLPAARERVRQHLVALERWHVGHLF
jgi:hypothetical protein